MPNIVRTPGYPLLLVPAIVFRDSVLIGVFEDLLLAAGSAWLIWRIVASLFPGSSAPVWAVLLYCFEPVGFLYSLKIMSETLFCAQLLLFIWLVIRFFDQPSLAKLALAALVLGSATYTRPVTLYLGLWLIPLFLLFPRTLPLVQRGLRAMAFVAVFAFSLTPWILRNAKVAEYPGFSSISDFGLYFYSAAAVQAKLENKSFAQEQEEMGFWDEHRYLQAHPEQTGWSRGQITRFMHEESQRIISRHLPSYLVIHARGFVIVLFDTVATVMLQTVKLYPEHGGLLARTIDQGFHRALIWLIRQYPIVGVTFLLLGLQLVLYYVLALLGVRYLPFAVGSFFVSLALYFILVSGGPLASGRLRAPIMPLACISASVSIAKWSEARRSRARVETEAVSI